MKITLPEIWGINLIEVCRENTLEIPGTKFERIYFDNYIEAKEFTRKYNADLVYPIDEDWYIFADEPYKVY